MLFTHTVPQVQTIPAAVAAAEAAAAATVYTPDTKIDRSPGKALYFHKLFG
jgi:hypothetical protein